MFDLTSSKLLILGIVALIVVGPKELPFLLRTIGKYVGMIRRQANEFRAQFDEAMREAELDSIKKDLENVARDTENTIRSAQTSFEQDVHATTHDLNQSINQSPAPADAIPPSVNSDSAVHSYDTSNGPDDPLASQPSGDVAAAGVPSADLSVPVPEPEIVPPAALHAEPAKAEFAKTEFAKTEFAKTELAKTGS